MALKKQIELINKLITEVVKKGDNDLVKFHVILSNITKLLDLIKTDKQIQIDKIMDFLVTSYSEKKYENLAENIISIISNKKLKNSHLSSLSYLNPTFTSKDLHLVIYLKSVCQTEISKTECIRVFLLLTTHHDKKVRGPSIVQLSKMKSIDAKSQFDIINKIADTMTKKIDYMLDNQFITLKNMLQKLFPAYLAKLNEVFTTNHSITTKLLTYYKKGFEEPDEAVQLAAICGWKQFICSHSAEQVEKRLTTITRPLSGTVFNHKSTFVAWLSAYWNLIKNLDPKLLLPNLLKKILLPVLGVCVNIKPCKSKKKPAASFPSLLEKAKLGAEMIGHLTMYPLPPEITLCFESLQNPILHNLSNNEVSIKALQPYLCAILRIIYSGSPNHISFISNAWDQTVKSLCPGKIKDKVIFNGMLTTVESLVLKNTKQSPIIMQLIYSLWGCQTGMFTNEDKLSTYPLWDQFIAILFHPRIVNVAKQDKHNFVKLIKEWPKPDMTFDNNVIYFANSILDSLRVTDEIYLDIWAVLVSRTIDLFTHSKPDENSMNDVYRYLEKLVLYPINFFDLNSEVNNSVWEDLYFLFLSLLKEEDFPKLVEVFVKSLVGCLSNFKTVEHNEKFTVLENFLGKIMNHKPKVIYMVMDNFLEIVSNQESLFKNPKFSLYCFEESLKSFKSKEDYDKMLKKYFKILLSATKNGSKTVSQIWASISDKITPLHEVDENKFNKNDLKSWKLFCRHRSFKFSRYSAKTAKKLLDEDGRSNISSKNKKGIKKSLSLVDESDDLDDKPLSQLASLILLEHSNYQDPDITADQGIKYQNMNSEKQKDVCEVVKNQSELKEEHEGTKNGQTVDFENIIEEGVDNEEMVFLPANSDFLLPTTQQKPAKGLLKSSCNKPITKNHRVKFNVELNQCQEYNVDTPMKRTPPRKRKRWPRSHLLVDGSPPAKKLNFPASRGLMLLKMSQAKITKADTTVEIAETSKTSGFEIASVLQQAQNLKSRVKCLNQTEVEKLSTNELAELLHIINPQCIITKTLHTRLSKK